MSSGSPAPSPSYRHVLVPLDGSALAAGALPTARTLADRFDADVHTISVAADKADAAELAAQTGGLLGTDGADPRLHVHVGDDPAAGIRDQAAALGSCLVCMSTHGRGRVADVVVGSVARSLLAAAREPTIAIGPACAPRDAEGASSAPLGGDRFVACVDGGDASERVLPVAAAWADHVGMRLTIVTVAEPSPPPLRSGAIWHRHHGPQADAEEYLRQLADQWRDAAPAVSTQVIYDPISASEGIRDYLDGGAVALLAVTTHARTGLSELVLGSGAAAIIHVSTVPVLVVPVPT